MARYSTSIGAAPAAASPAANVVISASPLEIVRHPFIPISDWLAAVEWFGLASASRCNQRDRFVRFPVGRLNRRLMT